MAPILDIRDLVTRFYTYEGVVQALDRISFQVPHDTFFGLVGESGCGKSVTVRSVMQIVPPPGKIEGGRIDLFPDPARPDHRIPLLDLSQKEMRQIRGNRISMIFQEPNAALNPIMTVGEQIAESYLFHQKSAIIRSLLGKTGPSDPFPTVPVPPLLRPLYHLALNRPDARLFRWIRRIPLIRHWDRAVLASAVRRSARLLETLGVPDPDKVVLRYPHQLSGGMKQRVVIAIALAAEPVLLIADEATSNLDVTVQAQILDLLNLLKAKRIISSVLLITHDLGVVAETCDRVGVMYAGTLCEEGRVEQIFQSPAHPYTRALLAAVPKMDATGKLASIPGSVPNLVHPPPGCRFHPRCPQALPVCRERSPEMVVPVSSWDRDGAASHGTRDAKPAGSQGAHKTGIQAEHRVACHLYGGEGAT